MTPTPHPLTPFLTAPRRAMLYRVAVALVPLFVVAGVLTDESAPHVVALVAALLSTGSAALHTPR